MIDHFTVSFVLIIVFVVVVVGFGFVIFLFPRQVSLLAKCKLFCYAASSAHVYISMWSLLECVFDDGVGLNVLGCQADILGTESTHKGVK